MKKSIILALSAITLLAGETGDSYQEYVEGSISTSVVGIESIDRDSSVIESNLDTAYSAEINLHLFKKYYDGIYIGYKHQFSDSSKEFNIEKKFGEYSVYFQSITSDYNITPYSMYTTTVYDKDGNSHILGNTPEDVHYDYKRYELRYYGDFPDESYIGLVYEDITTGVGDSDIIGGIGNYYSEAKISNFAVSFNIWQRAYQMKKDGFDITGLGAEFGYAEIEYTSRMEKDSDSSYGVWVESAYKYSFTPLSAFVVKLGARATNVGINHEYANIYLKGSLTF